MKITDVISFIVPNDVFSGLFVAIIVITSIVTMIWLALSAKPINWEKNWNKSDLNETSSDLDEYGSINELSEAVATKAEKIADIVPSLLLVFGLLGTFIGLGVALNDASSVLANANSVGMDGAMSKLMSMMGGLGVKFKTSTWGILCFILLNIVFNAMASSEKRLTWVINKVRKETIEKKTRQLNIEEQRQKNLLDSMLMINQSNADNNKNILDKMGQVLNDLSKLNTNHNQLIVETLNKSIDATSDLTATLSQNHDRMILHIKNTNQPVLESLNQLNKILDNQFASNIEELKNISKHNDLINQSVKALNSLTTDNHDTLMKHSKSSNKQIIDSLAKSNDSFEQSSKNSLQELQKIASYNEATQNAMQDFVGKTVASMSSIGNSADKMAEAASAVGNSANELNVVVDNLQSELKSVITMIKDDLGTTITNMGDSFENNMSSMSNAMSIATDGISTSVEALSQSVDKTLVEVTKVIEESMTLQRKSANEFTVTSDGLNTQIFTMTDLIQQLSGDITSGLSAISSNGRRMESLSKSFETITANNSALVEKMESLVQTNNNFSGLLNDGLQQFNQHNELTKDYRKSLADNASTTNKHMENLVKTNHDFSAMLNDALQKFNQQNQIEQDYRKSLANNTSTTNKYLESLIDKTVVQKNSFDENKNILQTSLDKLSALQELSNQLVSLANSKAKQEA
ncbi:hypothetical protein E6P72_00415 [Moraxella osloensis]|nr:hypothetical protein [Moraxella osloensis]MDI4479554.1 hypothetical protein [Moraxella osloensis]